MKGDFMRDIIDTGYDYSELTITLKTLLSIQSVQYQIVLTCTPPTPLLGVGGPKISPKNIWKNNNKIKLCRRHQNKFKNKVFS